MGLALRFEKRTQEKGIRRFVFRERAYVFRERPLVCRNGHQVAEPLTPRRRRVTLSHMKEISIRELHRRTGAWVRSARKYGAILVRDRNIAVAKLVPVSSEPEENLFKKWKPAKKFAAALDRPVGGAPVGDIISEDRNR